MIKTEKFLKWLEKGIEALGDGAAFCFNLYEDADEWTCEFINTNSIDKDDEDWPCDEKNIYSRENPLSLCTKKDFSDFEEVLELFNDLLVESLEASELFKSLSKTRTIAYGFVDGDLEYLN